MALAFCSGITPLTLLAGRHGRGLSADGREPQHVRLVGARYDAARDSEARTSLPRGRGGGLQPPQFRQHAQPSGHVHAVPQRVSIWRSYQVHSPAGELPLF